MLLGTHSGRGALKASALALALCALVVACKKEQPEQAAETAPTPAQQPAQPVAAQSAVSEKVAAMNPDALRTAATTALNEQRLYAPAGDNAMEYYVALRDKAPDDASVVSALTDLMPYALIATEQSIARDDFAEAQRLYALMEKADDKAPALPRLKQSIADAQASLAQRTADAEARTEEEAERQAELQQERQAEQERSQQEAAQQLARQQAAEQAAAQQQAEQQAAEQRAAEQRAAEQRAAEQRAAQQAQQPAQPAVSNTLRAISTPLWF